ncbi:MAG TPA: spermidine/putrescine ABC transporter substrate-binding protein [Gaiellaceae bacterium]|nr:spermidine/putrescine ABC transporter substrate-binding protein [Gaiellaceae bacterium]
MTLHPRESRYGRRELLQRGAAGAFLLSSMGTLLAACGGGDGGSTAELQIATPESPATWPIFDDNPMIASGLEPESGTLRIYNWNGYLWPKIKKDFAKEYGVKVEETFFSTTDEAVAKISSGAVEFDVFFPTTDRIGRLVLGKSLQPLNRDYLPNLANVWPSVQDPWYDKGSQYTVPYTTWTTGIGYRTDKISTSPADLSNPYEIYWDPAAKGKMFLLDDSRDAPAHMLLKNGIMNVNTENPDDIVLAKDELKSLIGAASVKLSTDDYTNLPEGKAWVHQMWSGSAISAQWYLPEGTGAEALGYWFPEDGRGVIGNDMLAIPSNAKNPVLAHLFLNYLLDKKHGYDNFSNYTGYQPPLTALDPDKLIADGVVPANLRTAIVRESDFDSALPLTELTPTGQTEWQNAWAEFKAGV